MKTTQKIIRLSLVAAGLLAAGAVSAHDAKVKVGLMLPYSGTYGQLGKDITDGFKLAVNEKGGRLGGKEIEYFSVDDESEPAKATDNANKLVLRDKVDVLIGTVHSGVAMGMIKVAKENNVLTIIPNAGAAAATGPLCAPNVFRTSFTNWQPAFPMGKVAFDKGHKRAVTLTWKYAAGEESVGGFKEGFEKAGGKVEKELTLPFPNVEFQPLLTEIASLKPDAVYVFFSGSGAVKFVKDYAAAGLKDKIPLYGPGFLTDGLLEAQGEAANGLETTLFYADNLDNARNKSFREAFKKAYGRDPDVFAVQGYDTGTLLMSGMDAVNGDVSNKKGLIAAMESATIDSPRGKFTLSKAHNPVQDIYLRKAVNGQNQVIGIAAKALADPAKGCSMN
ncbi:MAG: ABC transporter substrate-binding protein [Burkholderiales bacterium]